MKNIPVCTILVETDKGQFFTYAVAKSMDKADVYERYVVNHAKKLAKAKKARFIFADYTLEMTPAPIAHQATKDYAANAHRKVFK